MGRIIKKIGILFAIFAAALILYIVMNRERLLAGDTVYTAAEDTRFPVVYAQMYGRWMNPMQGYVQDMGNAAARDSLTVLPEDRALPVVITGGSVQVLGIQYEIRSLDLERLVEKTVLEDWQQTEGGIQGTLPIQNLLTRDKEYLLKLQLETESDGTINYYTRIVWTEPSQAQAMIDLAADFSAKTFSYEDARSLVTYLETSSTEDNSSYGRTTIRSSFAHLTWGRLKMQPIGDVDITLKEKDGIMGCVSLSYLASRQDEEGNTEYYEVEEDFTMKWNAVRTYLMDYDRTVNQIFLGKRTEISGKRLMLGITNDDRVEVLPSPSGQILAYRTNRALWSYNQKDRRLAQIFSFRSAENGVPGRLRGKSDIKLLKTEDNGDVDFLVYGYMSRGNHEGQSGIAGYHYEQSDNALHERFFIPAASSYEQLEMDLEILNYRSETDMLYLYLNHAIYGIDMTSNENMVVADALEEGGFAVSSDKARIAWADGGKAYEAETLHLMDLETGEKRDIRGGADECVRSLGFVGRDLVYGYANKEDLWMMNGRIKDLPMHAVEIMNDQMQVETRYERPGYYVAGVEVDESRIHLNRVTKIGDQKFAEAQQDTIVCNMDMGPGKLERIGWYASQDKGKVYFVQLAGDLRGDKGIHVSSLKKISFDQSETLVLQSNFQLQGMQFYAYGGGRLLGVTARFSEALKLAYDRMGIVTDQNHQILWSRVNRGTSRTIRDAAGAFAPVERHLEGFTASRNFNDGWMLLDARGCSMMQLLYFIDQGIPIMGYTGEGEYLVLCGFDQYNVTVYNPVTRETYKAGLNDSTEYFRLRGNDFLCAVQVW